MEDAAEEVESGEASYGTKLATTSSAPSVLPRFGRAILERAAVQHERRAPNLLGDPPEAWAGASNLLWELSGNVGIRCGRASLRGRRSGRLLHQTRERPRARRLESLVRRWVPGADLNELRVGVRDEAHEARGHRGRVLDFNDPLSRGDRHRVL